METNRYSSATEVREAIKTVIRISLKNSCQKEQKKCSMNIKNKYISLVDFIQESLNIKI